MGDAGHERAPDFGELLRRYRLAAGLSQEVLAERARLSPYGISALERGYRRTPQRETLELLVGALALSDGDRQAFETAARGASARRRDGATIAVGPWLGPRSVNLPLALTRFVGRGDQLGEIAALLRDHRFVTITGAGGVGKTQTALQAATAFSDRVDAICFVNLAPIGDSSLVATAIANALGVQEVPNHPLRETLVAFLRNKTALLLLDNCEHLIAEAATIANFLLRACPNLRILATSREALRAAGERNYRLPSLAQTDAVALFADRAQAAGAHFSLTDENQPTVHEICQHLDGIPLAIELAAAQVILRPTSSLAKELEDRLAILERGDRTAPPRHQTMHAAIDWSYELLNGSEQRVFERLSVFAGGGTIEPIRAVCEGDVADDVLALIISSLVGKSLLVAELEGDEPRYRMLEPFRKYASEKLKARGEEEATAQRHLLAYIDLARQFDRHEQHSTAYYAHPSDEIGNWRAAVQWALIEHNDVLGGQRLVAQVACSWGGTVLSDVRRWLPLAMDLVNEQTSPSVIAQLKLAEAHLAGRLQNYTLELSSAQEAIEYYREVGDALGLMRAHAMAGHALISFRPQEARRILEEALRSSRALGCFQDTTTILRYLGCCLIRMDPVASRKCLEDAFDGFKAAGDQYGMTMLLMDFGELAFSEGDPEAAARHIADFLADGRRQYTGPRLVHTAYLNLAECLIAVRRYAEAQKCAYEALSVAREHHLDVGTAWALGILATIAALRTSGATRDMHERALQILGFVEARLETLGSASQNHEAAIAAIRDTIGTDTVVMLMTDGATMTEDEAVEEVSKL